MAAGGRHGQVCGRVGTESVDPVRPWHCARAAQCSAVPLGGLGAFQSPSPTGSSHGCPQGCGTIRVMLWAPSRGPGGAEPGSGGAGPGSRGCWAGILGVLRVRQRSPEAGFHWKWKGPLVPTPLPGSWAAGGGDTPAALLGGSGRPFATPEWPGFSGNHLSCGSYQFHHRSRGSGPRGRPGPAGDQEPVSVCSCAAVLGGGLPASWQPRGGPPLCPPPDPGAPALPLGPRLPGEGAGPRAWRPPCRTPHVSHPLDSLVPGAGVQAGLVCPPLGPSPLPTCWLSWSHTAWWQLPTGRPHP